MRHRCAQPKPFSGDPDVLRTAPRRSFSARRSAGRVLRAPDTLVLLPSPRGEGKVNVAYPGVALAVFVVVVMATERLVALTKAAFPAWLEDERKNAAGEVDLVADRWRRLRVQTIAFSAALALTGCVAAPWQEAAGKLVVPLPLVALAASGGAAFWAHCIQRNSVARDRAVTRGAVEALRFRQFAESQGATPIASGRAARPASSRTSDRRGRLLLQLYAHAPDHILSPARTVP